MTTMIIISNSFHRTDAGARLRPDGTISGRVARRVRRELCGIDECRCGGTLGERSGDWAPHGDVPGIMDDEGREYMVESWDERRDVVSLMPADEYHEMLAGGEEPTR